MNEYLHTVQYYETDKMGITHHSNYIRWMEEARIDYLRQVGLPYEKMEEIGVFSPVVSAECRYKAATTFPETVRIAVFPEGFNGVRMHFRYEMRKEDRLVAMGRSEHCFVDRDGKLLRLKRDHPELYDRLKALAPEDEGSGDRSYARRHGCITDPVL